MIRTALIIHPGVRITSQGSRYTVTDPATGTNITLNTDTDTDTDTPPAPSRADAADADAADFLLARDLPTNVVAFLLANGLATGSSRILRGTLIANSDLTPVERRLIRQWGAAARTAAPSGILRPLPHALRAVARTWGPFTAAISLITLTTLTMVGAPPRTVLEVAIAPALLLIVVAAHEGGHWVATRICLGPGAGVLATSWRTCAVVHATTTRRNKRIIALAGPATGTITTLGMLVLAHGSPALATVATVLLTVNVLGFTPLTADGRDILTTMPCAGVSAEGQHRSSVVAHALPVLHE